ncbi:hypothetical protein LEP1GSC049_1347 [Leptospira kirschneri serovar Cynopteri str. 3522 CT]|uniref:Uncharacterized protein n=1 Tax=Leptospira kirschneri str. 200802841 TaxID=1193047 RepID=A0A828Y0P0_9LEPT|nr:hypothetical protein LEP1GSC131_1164 [Leptospira kirschneri str. 200802841]EMK17627.1 hypothetical protein LEP1GSC042_1489 [Leptospira kirschneri serovar Bim str. PUO 1247]EMN03671.1 hypothetical protein LEP1GSC046_1358 [Leptospira kirschneri serovar Bim str. 1051]EMN23824.1 hypothetical protein LEP1GSC065_0365 [Leptospira kirschneri serovar Sokoine str. RM1]EPG48880.1 hypothetical protein LEP1GSC049_1347 [Leptospira kirschneri serovar Cynopteri str. 3522 CT]
MTTVFQPVGRNAEFLRAWWSGGFEIFFCSSIKQDPTMRPDFYNVLLSCCTFYLVKNFF